VDPFALIVVGGMAALIAAILLLGRFYPGSGADVLDWKPTRSPETESQNELDDVDQMLEAANERRRRRGKPERTEAQVRAEVAAEQKDALQRSESYLADVDLRQMLELKNARRRARGQPEISEDEYRAQVLRGRPAPSHDGST